MNESAYVIVHHVFLFRIYFRDKQIPELAGEYVVQFVLALDNAEPLWSKRVGTYNSFYLVCSALFILLYAALVTVSYCRMLICVSILDCTERCSQ